MLQISEIVKKTEEMFDLFNEHFYDNELTRPAITVSPDGGRGAYGWCSIHEIWNASGEKYREINLCAEYLDRPMTELAATLLHEMAKASIKMVTDSVDAFVEHDVELAKKVVSDDDIVDKYFDLIKQEIIREIISNPKDGECSIDLLMIAKYFERIGDHATNIAEWVVFSVTGIHKEG